MREQGAWGEIQLHENPESQAEDTVFRGVLSLPFLRSGHFGTNNYSVFLFFRFACIFLPDLNCNTCDTVFLTIVITSISQFAQNGGLMISAGEMEKMTIYTDQKAST